MTTAALRKELHTFIDTIPDRRLTALKPLLADLADDADYRKPVIEPASPEEIKMAERRLKDYERDPSSFVPWSEIKKGQAKAKKTAPGKVTG
jgi:hypothetical protein